MNSSGTMKSEVVEINAAKITSPSWDSLEAECSIMQLNNDSRVFILCNETNAISRRSVYMYSARSYSIENE